MNDDSRERDWTRALGSTLEFLALLWDLDHALEITSSGMLGSLGVTAQQRMLIRIVGTLPQLTAGKLAELLRVHPGTLSAALGRLEQRGLLVRRRDPGDQRRVLVSLTAKGRRLDVPMPSTVEGAVARVLERTSESEIQIVRRCLTALTDALHEQGECAGKKNTGVDRRPRRARRAQ